MNESRPDAIVLLSGGLDSMVAAGLAKEQGFAINALTIDYKQRHAKEIEAARRIASLLDSRRHLVFPFDLRLFGGSALTSDIGVPKGGLGQNVPSTYVPARNLIFLSLSIAWAEVLGARDIFIGINALDFSGYPDCRPEFVRSFRETAIQATREGSRGEKFEIHAPLQDWSKARIANESRRLELDPSISWSCYDPSPDGLACGLCDSCRLRRRGFQEAKLIDHTVYAADTEGSEPGAKLV